MKISGFTLVHNAIEGGYPLREAIRAVKPYVSEIVAVDIQSTDGTLDILRNYGCRTIRGKFYANDTTRENFKLHTACEGDIIIFFEADEVWEEKLLSEVFWEIENGRKDIGTYRIQVTQNFQRIKQYPIPVYRVFSKGDLSYYHHPTNVPEGVYTLPLEAGLIWDCSNCFRDNWLIRKRNQVRFFSVDRPLFVPEHFTENWEYQSDEELQTLLQQDFWTWKDSPLKLPDSLKPLVGKVKYE